MDFDQDTTEYDEEQRRYRLAFLPLIGMMIGATVTLRPWLPTHLSGNRSCSRLSLKHRFLQCRKRDKRRRLLAAPFIASTTHPRIHSCSIIEIMAMILATTHSAPLLVANLISMDESDIPIYPLRLDPALWMWLHRRWV